MLTLASISTRRAAMFGSGEVKSHCRAVPGSSRSFKDDKQVGLWKRYHPNGQLYDKGEYNHRKKSGELRTFDAKGNLTKTATFKLR